MLRMLPKKREQRVNNQSLAEALGSFLQQWQAQTQPVTDPVSNRHNGQTRKVEWQFFFSPAMPD